MDRSVHLRQVQAGGLRRVGHSIYRLVRSPATSDADLVIAWLETGPASAISHDSALDLYHLSDALPAEIHCHRATGGLVPRPGILPHIRRIGELQHSAITYVSP